MIGHLQQLTLSTVLTTDIEPEVFESENPNSRLIPLMQWNRFHPWPSTKALRWLVYRSEKNGFSVAVRRVGRRVLIDEASFFEWVESQNVSMK